MSIQTQKKNMQEIANLLETDLSYIHGERESGPNGAKKVFLTKSASFLRALAKDLHFTDYKVNTNAAGIACSGEVTLYGVWNDGEGIMLQITQPFGFPKALLYRKIKHIKNYTGEVNQWLSLSVFQTQDYQSLCGKLLALCDREEKAHAA